jgi:peptide/nickel transport system permease protein
MNSTTARLGHAARELFGDRSGAIGAGIIAFIALAAIVGPFLSPYSPIAIDHAIMGYPRAPSFSHWLGTDMLGRDQLTRLLYGARVSFTVGLTAMMIGISVGTIYGAIAASAGGKIDAIMMRFVDALLSFPTFFLILTVEALTSKFSLFVIVLIIGLLSWMGVARLVRAEVLTLRERDFISAATALGASRSRLLFRHLIPNALGPVLVAASFAVGDNILTEAGLSYLGLGVQVPAASWGNMLQDALEPMVRSDWWLLISPGLCIVITLLGFSLFGEGIRVVLNPQLKENQ